MKIIGVTVGTIFGFAVLLGLLAGGYFALSYVADVFGALGPQMRSLAYIGVGVVLLAALIVAQAVKSYATTGRPAQDEKSAIYSELLAVCIDDRSFASAGLRSGSRTLVELERDLALNGGGRVVTAYLKLRRLESAGEASDEARVALLKTLLTQMRRDLGTDGSADRLEDVLEVLIGRPTASATDIAKRT